MIFSALSMFASYFFFCAVYDYYFLTASNVTQKNAKEIMQLYQKKTGIYAYIEGYLDKIASRFTKKLSNSEVKREQIEKLKRAGINITYEKYITQKIIIPITLFLCGYLFSLLVYPLSGIFAYIVRIAFVFFTISAYNSIDHQVERKLQELRNGIITEMPSFLSTYRYSPPSKTLIDIIKDFSKNTQYMRYDLNLLQVDIDQYGTEKALRLFGQRVNILEVDEVVSILINDLNGNRKDSLINVEILENKFTEKYQHYLEDKLKNRPFYLELLNILAVSSILLLFVICVFMQLIDGLIQIAG